jgi:hypothetical protein
VVRHHRVPAQPIAKPEPQRIGGGRLAVSDEHLARANVTAFDPLDDLRVVSVGRQPLDLSDVRAHRHVLAVDLELGRGS